MTCDCFVRYPVSTLVAYASLLIFIYNSFKVITCEDTVFISKWINVSLNFVLFFVFGFLLLVSFRYPVLSANVEFNPDESQMLAEAITYLSRPVFWKLTDVSTHGPLDVVPLTLPFFFGYKIDYISGRIVGITLIALSIAFTSGALWCVSGRRGATTGAFPMILFFSLARGADFIHYSSEIVSIFIISVIVFAIFYDMFKRPRSSVFGYISLFATGVLLASLPFAKLQSAYCMVALFCISIYTILEKQSKFRREELISCLALISGCCFFVLALFIYLVRYGAIYDFYQRYIITNTSYIGLIKSFSCSVLMSSSPEWVAFSCFVFIASVAPFLFYRYKITHKSAFFISLVLFVTSIFSILTPRRDFPHYLQYAIIPASLIVSLVFSSFIDFVSDMKFKKTSIAIIFVLASLSWFYPLVEYSYSENLLPFATAHQVKSITSTIIAQKQKLSTLSVWGWSPNFFVETQLPSATRDIITTVQMLKGFPSSQYYKTSYLQDLMSAPPDFFIDTVSDANNKYMGEFEMVSLKDAPELNDFIGRNYVVIKQDRGVVLYKRVNM